MTPGMVRLVREQPLGFVATVNADGSPNLSPKGTFIVIDTATVAFADIRSPGTLRNLASNPAVEINFVDPFTRRGCRLFGTAQIFPRGEPEFDRLSALWSEFGSLMPRMRAAIVIAVTRAIPLFSPAYDGDATEDEVRRTWTGRFRAIQPGGRFME